MSHIFTSGHDVLMPTLPVPFFIGSFDRRLYPQHFECLKIACCTLHAGVS
jgi:hypothetical protein